MSHEPLVTRYRNAVASGHTEQVLQVGGELLISHRSALKDDVWPVLESVTIAAAELKHNQWVAFGVQQLQAQFPNCRRIERLMITIREALGDFAEVDMMLAGAINERPDDPLLRKRLIVSRIERNDITGAIGLLIKHLIEFSADEQSWRELGNLYAQQGMLSQAAFCYDELLIHQPDNMWNLLAAADCRVTLGETEIAQKLAASALLAHPTSCRCLWSYIVCSMELPKHPERAKTVKIALGHLRNTYQRMDTANNGPIDFSSKIGVVGLRILEQLE